jgi:hypothetical protein
MKCIQLIGGRHRFRDRQGREGLVFCTVLEYMIALVKGG